MYLNHQKPKKNQISFLTRFYDRVILTSFPPVGLGIFQIFYGCRHCIHLLKNIHKKKYLILNAPYKHTPTTVWKLDFFLM